MENPADMNLQKHCWENHKSPFRNVQCTIYEMWQSRSVQEGGTGYTCSFPW